MTFVSSDVKEQLDNLMMFLKSEIEEDEIIHLEEADFGFTKKKNMLRALEKIKVTMILQNIYKLLLSS